MAAKRRFIQVLAGPRQVGKTTLARAAMEAFDGANHYASADDVAPQETLWIEQQWTTARRRLAGGEGECLLVLDEIQKIPLWSETIKRLWAPKPLNEEQDRAITRAWTAIKTE